VAWVCSGEAAMLVGHTLHLDGGFGPAAWRAVLDPLSPAGDGDPPGSPAGPG